MDRFSRGLPDPQEARVVGECDGCGGEIYEGEEIVEFEGFVLHRHSNCAEQFIVKEGFVKVAS